MRQFMPGLELNRLFYAEVAQPLLAARFPDLIHSAGLLGYGSDVLGYDTAISTDHEWGPRLLIFLRDEEYPKLHQAIGETLSRELPPSFRGYPTNFSEPFGAGAGVRLLEPGEAGQIKHHISVMTVADLLEWELGVRSLDTITARDWLTFPEQKLLEVTAGAVYDDGLGQLEPLRQRLSYYPHDVWVYRLAAQWQRISQEEAFVGRCGDVGDDLGSRIVAARLVRDVMRLCFLLERRYVPYSKWFGTAFSRLACAGQPGPHLTASLAASNWQEREAHLADAYEAVASLQNALALTDPLDPTPRRYHDRPYRVIHAERFANALATTIQDEELRRIMESVGLVGAVDQFADSTDILSHAGRSRRLGRFLGED
ncbi:MAG TPA: DUF4037 domain-containing protein [Ktedonobacterales bacterium]|nr:DUF4037 domain-containing protein [Ktedonobacterales bacterium]